MPATVHITIEDITTQLLTYDKLRIYRSATLAGTYSLIATEDLVAGQYHYSYVDAVGSVNSWYKYTLYNATGPVESGYSDIFRPFGTTRLRIRQRALSEYRAGLVMVAAAGGTTTMWKTADPRVATSLFRASKFVSSWLMPTSAAVAALEGATRFITANATPANGELSVDAWSHAPQAGDEGELHWLARPEEWNDAVSRGLARYWYIDRVPLVGLGGSTFEYDLSKFPWLKRRNLHSVWYFPTSSSVEQPWAGDGKWYSVRDDRDRLTLSIYPAIDTSVTLYLECTRPMPSLYTDDAQPPSVCNEDLASALAYDELLATLTRPGTGSSQDHRVWIRERRVHVTRLNRLLREHRPRPRYTAPMLSTPPVVPQPFSAR